MPKTLTTEDRLAQLIEELSELFPDDADAAWLRFYDVTDSFETEMTNHVLDTLVMLGVLQCTQPDCREPHSCDCAFTARQAA